MAAAFSLGNGAGIGAFGSLSAGVVITLPIGIQTIDVIGIEPQGLTKTTTQVEIEPGKTNTFEVTLPPSGNNFTDPEIRSIQLEINTDGPQLTIRGDRFTDNSTGTPQIQFRNPDNSFMTVNPNSVSNQQLRVTVPQGVVFGLAQVSVLRPEMQQNVVNSSLQRQTVTVESQSVHLRNALGNPDEYVFAALGNPNQVAVLNASNSDLIARIPIQNSNSHSRSVAVTSDLTRAYVSLRPYPGGEGSIAVIDTQTLQEVDTLTEEKLRQDIEKLKNEIEELRQQPKPNYQAIQKLDNELFKLVLKLPEETTGKITPIELPPGASPFWVVSDPNDHYLYVSEENATNHISQIYVIDIRPQSPTYHQLVQTIAIDNDEISGLRGLAISSDGERLYAAAPDRKLYGGGDGEGQIIVINIDPSDQPSKPNNNPRHWREVIAEIPSLGVEPYGITAGVNPNQITFTNRLTDGRGTGSNNIGGFGVINITKNDPLRFRYDVQPFSLNLGTNNDYFDVNNGVGIAILPAKTLDNQPYDYAFVTGMNLALSDADANLDTPERNQLDPLRPAGGNIGLIRDPFGDAELIAATRPIPLGFPDNLVLSPDGSRLFAGYRGSDSVFVFDVQAMMDTLTTYSSTDFTRRPIDDLFSFGQQTQQDRENDLKIDVNADYTRINPNTEEPYIFEPDPNAPIMGDPAIYPVFGVPKNSENGPIATGGNPQGLAVQDNWLQLVSPVFNSEGDRTPNFEWTYRDDIDADDIEEVKLYVSVLPEGQGLLPKDNPVDRQGGLINLTTILRYAGDVHPNRILTATWKNGQWKLSIGVYS